MTVDVCAQTRLQVDSLDFCSYYGETVDEDLYSFDSDREAEGVVAEIMRVTVLPQNFKVKAANVPNAAAVFNGGERLILYSQSFIRDIQRRAGTDWSGKSILAHEIGHHLAAHTLRPGGGAS